MLKCLIVFVVMLSRIGCASNMSTVEVSWEPSVTGTDVKNYILQTKIDNEGWVNSYDAGTSLFWIGDLQKNHKYRFRVVGVDSLNRVGVPSLASDVLLLRSK